MTDSFVLSRTFRGYTTVGVVHIILKALWTEKRDGGLVRFRNARGYHVSPLEFNDGWVGATRTRRAGDGATRDTFWARSTHSFNFA